MEENKGFNTNDKRGFADDTSKEETVASFAAEHKEGELKVDFSTFILSMSSSAFLHLGEIPNPDSGEKQKNLPAAKQTIDIIVMLQEKSKGNLTADENRLIENILYELRMQYMQLIKG